MAHIVDSIGLSEEEKDALIRVTKDIVGQPPSPDWSEVVHSHRIGRFAMSAFTLRVNPQAVADMMRNLIIVRAEMMYPGDCIDYTAFSPIFEPGSIMLDAPRYLVTCTDGVWAFVRQA